MKISVKLFEDCRVLRRTPLLIETLRLLFIKIFVIIIITKKKERSNFNISTLVLVLAAVNRKLKMNF